MKIFSKNMECDFDHKITYKDPINQSFSGGRLVVLYRLAVHSESKFEDQLLLFVYSSILTTNS